MKALILIAVFLAVFLLVISFYYLEMDRRTLKKEKYLKRLARERRKEVGEALNNEAGTTGLLESITGRIMDVALIESLLISADVPISVGRFLAISLGMGLLFIVPPMILATNPFVIFLFLIIGALIPTIYVFHLKKKREETLVKQLPDAIEMIARAIKAGQSTDGALQEVGRGFPPPIGSEISAVYDEVAMGLPFETAIRNLENRYPGIPDIKILCTTFIVQRETGGNLTEILEGLSSIIRDRFRFKMYVKALTAEGRTTSLLLGLIPFGFAAITWFLNPKYISILFVHPTGKKLLLCAIFLEALGFYVMRRMARINI